ncbi:MAG: DUF2510 domain-containing protein [Coriobacteriales bacterium]|jgi:hypothetical protein|nr:DUF2510 domain-containing protein [Coriobacteriales bacterium]
MTDAQILAGWYPDPEGDTSKERYWDGIQWTDQYRGAVVGGSTSQSVEASEGVTTPVVQIGSPVSPVEYGVQQQPYVSQAPVQQNVQNYGAPYNAQGGAPGYNGAPYGAQGGAPGYGGGSDDKGKTVLVLGIVSLSAAVLGFILLFGSITAVLSAILNIGGLVCGIVGAVMGVAVNKKAKTQNSSTGFILSAVGIGVNALLMVSCLACTACLVCFASDILSYY